MSPRVWLAAAALLLCVDFWALRPARWRQVPAFHHENVGESLLHGVDPNGWGVSFRMPAASAPATAFFDHLGFSPDWRLAPAYAEAALVPAVAAVLGLGRPMQLAAVAGALLLSGRGPSVARSPEPLFALWLLVVAALAALHARAPSRRSAAALAAAVGSSLLYRSDLILLPLLLAGRELRGPRGARARTLLLLVGPYLFLAPWLWMNWTVDRAVVPIQRRGADLNILAGALGLEQSIEVGPQRVELLDAPLAPGETLAG